MIETAMVLIICSTIYGLVNRICVYNERIKGVKLEYDGGEE